MQVSNPNNVKIYNLSAGKSLPEWLSEQTKRKRKKQDPDLERRLELIQDFEMPSISSCVKVSPDGKYICATGTYKPRLRCYDVSQLSMKFERGLDAEVIKFIFLEENFGKLLFLQDDRYIELHTQFGRHHRFRIPKYGRDLDYHKPSCNAYFVGASSDVYRFNLETGQFQAPLATNATEIFCCEFNPQHYLFACGTKEGTVECWDPRDRSRAGVLDITKGNFIENTMTTPAVTSLKFRDGLTMGVGTSTGHVLLYDIRSGLPNLVKDHQYDLKIKDLAFHDANDLVLSMDSKIVKLWDRNTGKPYTSIQPEADLNSMCLVRESGLIFMANESPKIQTYYVPSLGTAPKWCAFLDTLTEELEESEHQTVYDDYKFVTLKELEELGLSKYIGSNLLRAYMHGFFIDIRLYRKFKSIAEPFSYEQFRKDQIRKKIEEQTENQFKTSKKKLPAVNKDLAYRLQKEAEEMAAGEMHKKKKMKKTGTNLLEDSRFSALFEDKNFAIDTTSEEYRLLNPVLARMETKKSKPGILDHFDKVQEEEEEEIEGRPSEEESSSSEEDDDDSEDERPAPKKGKQSRTPDKKQHPAVSKPKFFEMKEGERFHNLKQNRKKQLNKSLAERIAEESKDYNHKSIGNKEYTYRVRKNFREEEKKRTMEEHKGERRKVKRLATDISKQFKAKPKYWMGQRVK